jgi:hypothetical protein
MNTTALSTESKSGFRQIEVTETLGGGTLAPRSFGEIVAFSEVMARSRHAIPKHLRDNPGACMAVTLQAMRWQMDPFSVAGQSYCVNDMIAYQSQLFAAVVHTRAPIKRRPEYSFSGEGSSRRCMVSVQMLDGSAKSYQTPTLGSIKVQNSPLWKGDPDQQLGYFAIRSWARRHCPEVLMGVYTPEELDDSPRIGADRARDVTPRSKAPNPNDPPNPNDAFEDTGAMLDDFETQCAAASTIEALEEVRDQFGDRMQDLANGDDRRAKAIYETAAKRIVAGAPPDDARQAVLDKLRGVATQGSRKLNRALGGLTEREQPLISEDDVRDLRRMAEKADGAEG